LHGVGDELDVLGIVEQRDREGPAEIDVEAPPAAGVVGRGKAGGLGDATLDGAPGAHGSQSRAGSGPRGLRLAAAGVAPAAPGPGSDAAGLQEYAGDSAQGGSPSGWQRHRV